MFVAGTNAWLRGQGCSRRGQTFGRGHTDVRAGNKRLVEGTGMFMAGTKVLIEGTGMFAPGTNVWSGAHRCSRREQTFHQLMNHITGPVQKNCKVFGDSFVYISGRE